MLSEPHARHSDLAWGCTKLALPFHPVSTLQGSWMELLPGTEVLSRA